jgi:hypothetical protein
LKRLLRLGFDKILAMKLVPSTRIERVTLPLGGGCSIH